MANRRPPPRKGQPPRRGPNPGGPRRPESSPQQRESLAPRAVPGEAEGPERLQKVLAHAGIGSRRSCEQLISQGRVTINGQVVRELGTRVDPQQAKVEVDGQRVQGERLVYFAVHKPKGYVSTNNDPAGKPRVIDLLPEIPQRVYTVGRLDEQSTGLLLLTNDGELANKLAHPKFGVEKIYRVVVAGEPGREVLDQLTQGVWLAEGKVRAKRVRIVGQKGQATVMEMVLAEGKNREIRRMLARFGHKVMSLTRIAVGPIGLKGIGVGECRPLSAQELDLLRQVAAGQLVSAPRFPDRRDRKPRPGGRPTSRPTSQAGASEGTRPGRPSGPFSRDPANGREERGDRRPPARMDRPSMGGRPMQGRPPQGRPTNTGPGDRQPPRIQTPSRPTADRHDQRTNVGQGRPPRPGPGERGPAYRAPRPPQGNDSYNRTGQDSGPSSRPPRPPQGEERHNNRPGQDRRPDARPPRPSQASGSYQREGQDRGQSARTPRHSQGGEMQNRPGQDRGPGGRPSRPGGSQGRPASGPPPLRVKRPPTSVEEMPSRKIIGLDIEPGVGKRPPRRAPRASLSMKRSAKRPKPGDD